MKDVKFLINGNFTFILKDNIDRYYPVLWREPSCIYNMTYFSFKVWHHLELYTCLRMTNLYTRNLKRDVFLQFIQPAWKVDVVTAANGGR